MGNPSPSPGGSERVEFGAPFMPPFAPPVSEGGVTGHLHTFGPAAPFARAG